MIIPKLCFLTLFMSTFSAGEYPKPHLVLLGPTRSGKSSLAKVLLGCDPLGNDCTFNVCGGLDSCTVNTTIGSGQWLGVADNFTIVDTPGFGESDGSDNKHIQDMIEILDNELCSANVLVLVIEGSTPWLTSGLYDMLKQISTIFGEKLWNYMMIGVSKWMYSKSAIDEREATCDSDIYGDPSDYCKNEAWFMREMSQQLREKFGIKRNLTFAFMDSWSQSGPNLIDKVQQSHWIGETNKLWIEAASRNETFDFRTIDDVLEENALFKKEINRLHDIISEDIKQLKENVTSLDNAIHHNSDTIADIEDTMSTNSDTIADMEDTISTNRDRITENRSLMMGLSEDVTDLEDCVINVSSTLQQQETKIGDLSVQGRWCGSHNDNWLEDNTVITYDKLIFSNTNMNISRTPLDIDTGIFTAPLSGTYTVSFSLSSFVNNAYYNNAFLSHNGAKIDETQHRTYSRNASVDSTSGRLIYIQALAGDTISLVTTTNDSTYGLYNILTCFEYNAV